MSFDEPSSPDRSGRNGPRVSLACIPCRTRHVRCNAAKPVCSRCISDSKQCFYTKSRRGGLDKAALMKRRAGISRESQNLQLTLQSQTPPSDSPKLSASLSSGSLPDILDVVGAQSSTFNELPILSYIGPQETSNQLITLFYEFFHGSSPCVLPLRYFNQLCASHGAMLQPLVLTMQYIGSLFDQSAPSDGYKKQVEEIFEQSTHQQTGFMVQAYLLYCIAIFWCDERESAKKWMDKSTKLAISLGMHKRDFALSNCNSCPVLAESWRRTWWMVYTTEAHIAAMERLAFFPSAGVDFDVELPCEEHQYHSGNIPIPRTLQEYDLLEFDSSDAQFSSFAHMIGVIRRIAHTLEGLAGIESLYRLCLNMDAAVDGWMLLLPCSKKDIVSSNGSVDELMFQAHMVVHATIVSVNRPFSNIIYNSIEAISGCSPPGPLENMPPAAFKTRNVHTVRCLRSNKAQIQLISLCDRPTTTSPFVICMHATNVIAHLAACQYLFTGRALNVARDQIRVSIGYLKSFENNWPAARRTVREIQTIAHEILSSLGTPNCRIDGAMDTLTESDSSSADFIGPLGRIIIPGEEDISDIVWSPW